MYRQIHGSADSEPTVKTKNNLLQGKTHGSANLHPLSEAQTGIQLGPPSKYQIGSLVLDSRSILRALAQIHEFYFVANYFFFIEQSLSVTPRRRRDFFILSINFVKFILHGRKKEGSPGLDPLSETQSCIHRPISRLDLTTWIQKRHPSWAGNRFCSSIYRRSNRLVFSVSWTAPV